MDFCAIRQVIFPFTARKNGRPIIYELIEWWVALLSSRGAEAFLGTQGYVWDTQSDMAYALIGTVVSLATLSNFHNEQLIALKNYQSRATTVHSRLNAPRKKPQKASSRKSR